MARRLGLSVKVLIFLNWLGRGGVETMLFDCLPGLRARGIEIEICCQGPRRAMDDEFERAGCHIHRIRKCALPLETAWRIGRVIDECRPALLHSHMGPTSGGAALAAARRGVPIAVSIHNSPQSPLYEWSLRPLLRPVRSAWLAWHRRLLDRHARIFLGHSAANLDAFAPGWRNDPARYRQIRNGIKAPPPSAGKLEARRTLGLDPSRLVVLHIGSFRPQKNHAGLFTAFNALRRREPDAELVVIGGEFGRARILQLAASMGLADKVRFEDERPDIWPFYAAADALLSTSLFEGFGNVVAEAESAGLPVVASDIPAHRESVAPAAHRFLFPLPDYERAAALVLEQAAAARKGNNPWVASAREHIRANHAVDRMTETLAAIYAEEIGRG